MATPAGYSFVTLEGETAVAPRFERMLAFSEGRAAARLDGQWGFTDTTGRRIVPSQYEQVFAYRNGYTPGYAKTAAGLHRSGRPGVAPAYEAVQDFAYGLAPVAVIQKVLGAMRRTRWGFIDVRGEMVIPPQFTRALAFSEGLAAVRVEECWGYIDREGYLMIPPRYEQAHAFQHGVALVVEKGRLLYIDRGGRVRWQSPTP